MGNKLYVGNLPYSVRDSDLEQAFGQFGAVTSAKVMMERDTGRSKGFGFVEMSSSQEAEAAIRGNAKRPAKVQLERNQWRDRVARFKDEVFAIHRKFASLMREMDGWKDNGVMWKLLVRPMNKD